LNTDMVAAVNDAVILGVDAINISIGRACGPIAENEPSMKFFNDVYKLVDKVGIAICIAAGNDSSSAAIVGLNNTENPDSGVIGAPGSYLSTLAAASIDANPTQYISFNGKEMVITSAVSMTSQPYNFYDILGTENVKNIGFVVVPGFGTIDDLKAVDVVGKIAIVNRGNISFTEKAANAAAAGAIGCIIYNNEAANIRAQLESYVIPTAVLSMADGKVLEAAKSGELTIDKDKEFYSMSSFSSWGALSNLDMGIDLTAPGGEIYSCVPQWYSMIKDTDDYINLSGTSMASPNMASAALVMKQYLKTEFPGKTDSEIQAMTYQIMMSTAKIVPDGNGNPASVRKQGAGLISIDDAVMTDAYLTVTGTDRTKLNLGSDVQKSGVYTLNFNLVNISENEVKYDISALTFTESAENGKVLEQAYMLDPSYVVTAKNAKMNGNTITVEANSTAKIKVVITLTEANKNYLNETFKNGMFVEGFAILTAYNSGVDLSIPWISFYGDWDHLPMFEPTNIDEVNGAKVQMDANSLNYSFEVGDGLRLTTAFGQYNAWYSTSYGKELPKAGFDKIAIGNASRIAGLDLCMYRNAEKVEFNFVDEYGKAYYVDDTAYDLYKAFSYQGQQRLKIELQFNGVTGLSAEDFLWANNQTVNFEVNAYFDMNKGIYETLTYPIYIDYEKPTLKSAKLNDVEGKKILSFDAFDNHMIMNFAAYTQGVDGLVKLSEYAEPVVSFNRNEVNHFDYDITENYKDIVGGKLVLLLRDYAMNEVKYEIDLNAETEGKPIVEVNDESKFFTNDEIKYLEKNGVNFATSAMHQTSYIGGKANVNANDAEWVIENGVVIAYNGVGGDIVIPDGVTKIGERVFADNKTIKTVKFNEGLKEIGWDSFTMCSFLTSLQLPSTLETIGREAFSGCRRLTVFDFNSTPNLKRIGNSAFVAAGLKEIEIPKIDGLVVESKAFYGMLELEKLIIRADIVSEDSFTLMPKLTQMDIYGKLELTGDAEFTLMTNIEVINFYGNQGNLGFEATEVDPWGGISYRQSFGFNNMPKLKKVNFFGDVESIKGQSFSACKELTEVVFHGNLGTIGYESFAGSSKLTQFSVSADNPYFFIDETTKIMYNTDKTVMYMPSSWNFDGIVEVPETVTTLRENQFAHSANMAMPTDGIWEVSDNHFQFFVEVSIRDLREEKMIKGVKLHKGITVIPKFAFFDCVSIADIDYNGAQIVEFGNNSLTASGINRLVLPQSTKKLGYGVWAGCTKLTEVIFNDGLETIIGASFEGCTALTEVVVPEIVSELTWQMFCDCTSLVKVTFENKNISEIPNSAFRSTRSLIEIIGLDNITMINYSAFYESGIKEYIVPATVEIIMPGAFEICDNLTKLVLQEGSLTSVVEDAFPYCVLLKEIYIPSTLVDIDFAVAFEGCSALEDFTVSENNTKFASFGGALYNKSMTDMIMYPAGKTDASYTTPDTLTSLGLYVLMNTKLLKEIVLPEVITIDDFAFVDSGVEKVIAPKLSYIGAFAFMDCVNLNQIDLTNIEHIEPYAFKNTALTNVVLGNKLSYVGMEAFSNCKALTNITIKENACDFDFSMTFYGALSYTVVLENNNKNFVMFENGLYSIDKTILYKYFGTEKEIIIPEGTMKVSADAFRGNNSVETIIFASTIKCIGDKAAYGCKNLTKLVFKSEYAPLLQGFYNQGESLYQNFGTEKLVVEHTGNDSYKTPVWMNICLLLK
ncbi:MAG: leucine-rich repeat protein, partial [Clostridia bacterium]